MACKTLARLCYTESSAPLFASVVPLCKMGKDDAGKKLVELLQATGAQCQNVDMTNALQETDNDKDARTALSVLPIYQNGSRGCFFDAASNDTFSSQTLASMVKRSVVQSQEGGNGRSSSKVGAFLFGYPHLLPLIQGEHLAYAFQQAKAAMDHNGITALDLNGVPQLESNNTSPTSSIKTVADLKADPVLGAALPHVDILHMNQDELALLAGHSMTEVHDENYMIEAMTRFVDAGVAIVAVTRGKSGCLITTGGMERFEQSPALPQNWAGSTVTVKATYLPEGTEINSNGAGDSFTAGLLTAALLRRQSATNETMSLKEAATFANLIAARHVDVSTRDASVLNASSLIKDLVTATM
jgi:sugar/nucleoside kinase (ribokinase family)